MPARTSFRTFTAVALAAILAVSESRGHGAYHDLVDRIRTKLKANPDDAALRYQLAEAHAAHEEWQSCLVEIDRVERLAPGVHPTGYLRGFALLIGRKYERAKESLDGFLKVHPEHAEALATRGRVLVKLEQPAAAVADFKRAMELTPSPGGDLVMDLALAYQLSGKPEEAGKAIDDAIESSPDKPSLLECALKIEIAAGMWDSALGRIDGLQKAAPRPEPWMAKRAELMTRAGRADDARAAWAALRDRLISLPSLDRGTPQNLQLLQQARNALGETAPTPVAAPPAP